MSDPTAPATRGHLTEAFVARDHPPCPVCRERLTAVSHGRCPHCEARLQVDLDRRDSGSVDVILGVLAAGLGTGFHVITAPAMLIGWLRNDRLDGAGMIAWTVGFVVTVGVFAGWVLGRRRIQRWGRARIRLAAAGSLLLAASLVGWLAAIG